MKINYNIKHDGRGEYPAEILANLNEIRQIEDIESFLHPSKDDMYSLVELPNIAVAYAKLRNAIDKKEHIGVLFDCDLDGVCSGAEMVRGLRDRGVDAVSFINDGKLHGVQMNAPYWNEMIKLDVLIVVDSLNGSVDAYKALAENGVDGWINSPGHRKNLLSNTNLCAIASYKNRSGAYYLTQLFAKKT